MKRRIGWILGLFFLAGMPGGWTTGWAEEKSVVLPENTDEALINPGMGWVYFHYSNRLWAYGSQTPPGDTLEWFPGVSVIYFRLPWCYLEPEEGKYRWDILDSYAQPWIARGKKIALRITACENRFRYATPQWVHEAGAKGIDYTFATFRAKASSEPLWEPDYKDPIFLEKLGHFLEAMGKRYNGNPDVAFIDVGTFGMWGEGHTGGTSKLNQEQADEIVKIHIDLHKKHFPDTLLCISDDVAGASRPGTEFPSLNYALEQGVTLRDDSILVQKYPKQWYHAELAQKFSARLPVIIEHEHYGLSRDKGAWDKGLLAESVEAYRGSYLSIHWWPKEFWEENQDVVKKINLRLGYRLELRKVEYPPRVKVGEKCSIAATWANVGVAPCYEGGWVTWTLCDEAGNIVWVCSDESWNVKELPAAPSGKAVERTHVSECHWGIRTPIPQINDGVFTYTQDHGPAGLDGDVPTLRPGKYRLFVSVGKRDGTPRIALPLKPSDGQRRYEIGTLVVE